MPSTIDWEAIRKANRKSRASAISGRKTHAILREKAKTSPDYAVIANPGKGTFQQSAHNLVFQRRSSLD